MYTLVAHGDAAQATDQLLVRIPPAVLFPPVAKAMATYTIYPDQLQLDGTLSSDPQHGTLTYQWVLASGPLGAVILNPTAAQTRVSAPGIGLYVFELTVKSAGGAATDSTSIQRNL